MSDEEYIPETRVLAIASHVSFGYVGNKMATFVMQSLGCDVSAIDTVHFSNHTAYGQWKGRKVAADEIQQLYNGLAESDLGPFDMMLSGYIASREAVDVVGGIARDLRHRSKANACPFFWVLDPVMGDEGRLYVAEDIIPVYRSLIREADLILPNYFEAELLSEIRITDMASLVWAMTKLHQTCNVPNIIVTSLRFSKDNQSKSKHETLTVVGSSCRSDLTARIFSITVPALPIFFSGTGDMFAALIVARLREAVVSAGLLHSKSWLPPDDVPAASLPLASATEKALASMHLVLRKTSKVRNAQLRAEFAINNISDKQAHLRNTKASEIRVVKFAEDLRRPQLKDEESFRAQDVEIDRKENNAKLAIG